MSNPFRLTGAQMERGSLFESLGSPRADNRPC